MLKKLLSAVASLMLFLAPMATLGAQEAEYTKMSKKHQRVYDASLALYGTRGPISHFLCSSTVVANRASTTAHAKYEYLLLTAGHCVTGGGLPEDLTFSVSDTIVLEDDVKDRTPVQVVRAEFDSKYDFAILYMESDKEYPVIEMSREVPKIESKVYTVNYSLGIAKQVSLGAVSSEVMTHNTPDCGICEGRFMVHVFAAGGASGAAVVDEESGKIVGIGEFGFPGDTVGLGCETISALDEWLKTPVKAADPKAQSPQSKATPWHS